MQQRGARVVGVYQDRSGWRVRWVGGDGCRHDRVFQTEEEARGVAQHLAAQLASTARTIRVLIDEYRESMIEAGNRPRSYEETTRRMRQWFAPIDEATPARITPTWMADRYSAIKAEPIRADGSTRSTDTHRNYLAEVKTFLGWLVGRGCLASNPGAGLVGTGKRKHGKAQLHTDEARRWLDAALTLATGQNRGQNRASRAGAVAAMMTLLIDLRAGEVVGLRVRDLDDSGRVIRVTRSKTAAGRRALEVPAMLRPLLVELAEGRAGAAPLLGAEHDRSYPRAWVRRICLAAGVPLVCAHGMRGTHSTLAIAAGATSHAVAAAMGHESWTTTATSYARPEAVDVARRGAVLEVLAGGRA